MKTHFTIRKPLISDFNEFLMNTPISLDITINDKLIKSLFIRYLREEKPMLIPVRNSNSHDYTLFSPINYTYRSDLAHTLTHSYFYLEETSDSSGYIVMEDFTLTAFHPEKNSIKARDISKIVVIDKTEYVNSLQLLKAIIEEEITYIKSSDETNLTSIEHLLTSLWTIVKEPIKPLRLFPFSLILAEHKKTASNRKFKKSVINSFLRRM